MIKTLGILFGLVYVLMGIAGLFDTSLVGTNGVFAADVPYSFVFLAVGAVLLFGALAAPETNRSINLTIGALLAIVALAGFLIVPERGEMLGMLVNGVDHAANFIVGLILAGTAYFADARSMSSVRRELRHAMQ